MREPGRAARCAAAIVIVCLLGGCYIQQPLPQDPTYRPASWEPIMGLRTSAGLQITFDEPGTLEAGRIVYRVDGQRTVMDLEDVDRLFVGRKTLDKKRTIIFSSIFLTAFAFFFASIKLDEGAPAP